MRISPSQYNGLKAVKEGRVRVRIGTAGVIAWIVEGPFVNHRTLTSLHNKLWIRLKDGKVILTIKGEVIFTAGSAAKGTS